MTVEERSGLPAGAPSHESRRAPSFRKHAFPLLMLLLIASTIFLKPLVSGEVFVVRDHFDYFQPLRWFTAQELQEGRLPLWNPYNASGEEWLANPQTGVFYPPAWLLVALPFPAASMLHLLFHVTLLGWGAYLLFARRASQGAALVGAVALMLSGPMLSMLDVSNNISTVAWIPLVLWAALEAAPLRAALALTMAFLAGEPFFAGVAALLFAVVVVARGISSRQPGRALRVVAIAAAVTIGLTAVQLVPFLEVVMRSDRVEGMDRGAILQDSMPLRDWIHAALPSAKGLPGPTSQQFIPLVYLGVPVVLLAIAGLFAMSRRRLELTGWLALLVGALFLASGPLFLAELPLTLFRYPARLAALVALPVVALAVAGWDRLRRDRRWIDLLLVLVISGDLLYRAQPLLQSAAFDPHPVPYPAQVGGATKFVRIGAVDFARRRSWISGYLNLYDRRYDAFTAAPFVAKRYVERYRPLMTNPTPERLSTIGAGVILSDARVPAPYRAIAGSEGVHAWFNPQVWPMAFHVSREPVTITPLEWELDSSHARVRVNAAKEGMVVLLQRHVPGWTLTIDGVDAQTELVDGVFRGVRIAKGKHEIVWRYFPASFAAGGAMTCVTLLSLFAITFVKRSR